MKEKAGAMWCIAPADLMSASDGNQKV